MDEHRHLWTVGALECVMISCCSGAELQVIEHRPGEESSIVLRELYPTKSDLYERARDLQSKANDGTLLAMWP